MQLVSFPALDDSVTGYLHEPGAHLAAHKVRPALIVCPGGGYNHISARESDDPAMEFFTLGFQVFILSYSLGEKAADYRPLRELARAVSEVRRNAAAWQIDPKRIAVMGFSAGGHLAASLGCLWSDSSLSLPRDCRPNALVLCYPVITMGEKTHKGTRELVTGGRENQHDAFSIEKLVNHFVPPVFVWHTVDDGSVPVENTLLLVSALQAHRIPFECHLFPSGVHGSSVCTHEVETPNPACRPWVELCRKWLCRQFDFEP